MAAHGSGVSGRHHGGAVGPEVDRPALEPVAERGRHRLPHGAVEAGGVAEEGGAAVAAVLVHGQRHAVGGGHRSASVHPRRAAPREANSVGAMPDPAADDEHSGDTADEAEVRRGQPALLRRLRGPRPRRHVRRVGARRPGVVHPSGLAHPPRVGRGVGLVVRAVRRPAAAAVHPHRRARGGGRRRGLGHRRREPDQRRRAAARWPRSTCSCARTTGWRLVAHHGSAVAPQA